jgi:NifU-like protein
MWDYTDKVLDLFYNPKNQGSLDPSLDPNIAVVFGEVGSIACGDALRLHLQIDIPSDRILDSRFQTFGCTSAIASSSALTELIKGLTLDEALKISNRDIAEYLGGLPEAKMHCSVMGQEALEAAIYKYRGITIEEHEEDESRMICTCFTVTESRIRRVVLENDLTTAEEVTHYIKAGGGCGSCLHEIDDLITALQKEGSTVPAAVELALAPAQGKLTTLQKIALIQQVIEEEIRPLLHADGGDLELFDIDGDRVQVRMVGATSVE